VTQAQIIALHGLLGLYQAALQHRNGFQIAPQHQGFAIGLEMQGGVLNGNVFPMFHRVIDVAPTQFGVAFGGLEHVAHFVAALAGHGVRPFATHPIVTTERGQFIATHRHVLDDALFIQQQGDVRRNANQLRQFLSLQARNFHVCVP